MSRPHSVTECKTTSEFVRVVEHQGGYVDNGGRHYKAHDGDGRGCVALPRHAGDLATGTRHSIVKALLALGFLGVLFVCGAQYLAGVTLPF